MFNTKSTQEDESAHARLTAALATAAVVARARPTLAASHVVTLARYLRSAAPPQSIVARADALALWRQTEANAMVCCAGVVERVAPLLAHVDAQVRFLVSRLYKFDSSRRRGGGGGGFVQFIAIVESDLAALIRQSSVPVVNAAVRALCRLTQVRIVEETKERKKRKKIVRRSLKEFEVFFFLLLILLLLF